MGPGSTLGRGEGRGWENCIFYSAFFWCYFSVGLCIECMRGMFDADVIEICMAMWSEDCLVGALGCVFFPVARRRRVFFFRSRFFAEIKKCVFGCLPGLVGSSKWCF